MVGKIDPKRLIEILADAGLAVRRYSGRGMSGTQGIGFTTEGNGFGEIANLIANLDDETERLQVAKAFCSVSTDNMGRSEIIIYWKYIEWPDDVNEADYRYDDEFGDDE